MESSISLILCIGVPVLQYGPPKVPIIEYGTPHSQGGHSVQQIQTGNHHHHQVVNHGGHDHGHDHGSNSLSFFEQIKQSLGFGGGESHSHSHQPHSVYGPPPQVNHFAPPKVHTKYGAPPKQHLFSKPPTVYGMILLLKLF